VIIGFLAWESTSVKTWGNSLAAAGISTGICYREYGIVVSGVPPPGTSPKKNYKTPVYMLDPKKKNDLIFSLVILTATVCH